MSEKKQQQQPNIILITTDQQRFDTIGRWAPSFMRTPHMNNLAYEGVTFSRAYAQCPVCVPSRVSIMGGRSSFSMGLGHNGPSSPVLEREHTLPAELRRCGYQTAAIGKMHFSPQRRRHGFEEMILPEDYYIAMERSGNPMQPMRHGLGQNEVYPGMATVPESMTLTSWIAEQSVDYIRTRRDPSAPFFLWTSFGKPHPPFDPPEPYYSMYRNCPIPRPVRAEWSQPGAAPAYMERFRQQWSLDRVPDEIYLEARAAYYGLITQIDYNIGRILGVLQDARIRDNTLILFTSDHGDFLGDHGTSAKQLFYEPSAHVPMILRMPKTWENRCNYTEASIPVTHSDIMATLVTAAGGTTPDYCEGIDMVQAARENPKGHRYIDARLHESWDLRKRPVTYFGITDGSWKYIYYPEGAMEQLFNLDNDHEERVNLLADGAKHEKAKELRAEIIRREKAREICVIEGDDLPVRPLLNDTEQERRDQNWPGYHTEKCGVDVCH